MSYPLPTSNVRYVLYRTKQQCLNAQLLFLTPKDVIINFDLRRLYYCVLQDLSSDVKHLTELFQNQLVIIEKLQNDNNQLKEKNQVSRLNYNSCVITLNSLFHKLSFGRLLSISYKLVPRISLIESAN